MGLFPPPRSSQRANCSWERASLNGTCQNTLPPCREAQAKAAAALRSAGLDAEKLGATTEEFERAVRTVPLHELFTPPVGSNHLPSLASPMRQPRRSRTLADGAAAGLHRDGAGGGEGNAGSEGQSRPSAAQVWGQARSSAPAGGVARGGPSGRAAPLTKPLSRAATRCRSKRIAHALETGTPLVVNDIFSDAVGSLGSLLGFGSRRADAAPPPQQQAQVVMEAVPPQ